MKQPIKWVFFDGDGVLLEWAVDPRQPIADRFGLPLEQVKLAHSAALKRERSLAWSAVSSRELEIKFSQMIALALLEEVGVPASQEDVKFVMDQWLHLKFRLIEGSIDILDYLRPKYRLALVTNAPPSRRTRELVELDLIKYFDPIVISGEVGVRKPDPTIYLEALKLADADPEEVAMIDDAEAFLDVAQQLGFGLPIFFDRYGESSGDFKTITRLSELKRFL